eukprot:g49508.t1
MRLPTTNTLGRRSAPLAISAADCEYIPTVTCPKVIPEIDATTTTHQATQTFSLLSYFPQSPASPLKNALGYHFDMAVDPRALLQGSSTYVTLSEDTVAQLQNALQLNAKTGRLEVLSERLAGIAAGRYMIHIGATTARGVQSVRDVPLVRHGSGRWRRQQQQQQSEQQ